MQIQRLRTGDAAVATKVIEALRTRGPTDLTSDYMSRFLDSDDHYLIAALDDDVPVGFALAYELARVDQARPMMLLYEIEVSESHHRQGIGTAMVDLLKGFCRERNVYKMWVATDRSNTAAQELYRSTGGTVPTDSDCLSFTYRFDRDSN